MPLSARLHTRMDIFYFSLIIACISQHYFTECTTMLPSNMSIRGDNACLIKVSNRDEII